MSFVSESDGQTSSSAYCFISNNGFHCVPIESFNAFSDTILNGSKDDHADFTPDKLYLKNKNLLYSLNNPSLSDVEPDNSNLDKLSTSPGVIASPLNHSHLTVPSLTSASATPEASCSKYSRSPSPSEQDIVQNGGGNNVEHENPSLTSIINNYETHAIYLPKLIVDLHENLNDDFIQLRDLLSKVFPKWSNPDHITFKKLTGGITNMLLSCKYPATNDRVLIRVYGHGTNLIIDRHREFILHLILNSINLAPPIYSRFKNGLIYGFLPGRSLEPEELSNENLYPLIAQQLGNWHKNLDYKVIEGGVENLRDFSKKLKGKSKSINRIQNGHIPSKKNKKKSIANIWELIEDWINIVPVNENLISSFNNNLDTLVDEDNLKDIIIQEFEWLKNVLINSNSPIVASHCDLLSGNVIVPDEFDIEEKLNELPTLSNNPIKFIDYEYMLPAPRAFDIANHLAEWQGFQCDRSRVPIPSPNNPILTKWVKGYLNNQTATNEEVNDFIKEISTFFGLPGFYWGIWALIQNEISNIDFNYSNYGVSRLQEYWDWKIDYLKKNSQDQSN